MHLDAVSLSALSVGISREGMATPLIPEGLRWGCPCASCILTPGCSIRMPESIAQGEPLARCDGVAERAMPTEHASVQLVVWDT